MAGFYRSSYTDKDGNKKYLVVTQFEATDARRAFPCWDEPNLKATFDVTLVVDPSHTALSNMNETEERLVQVAGKTLKEVKFARTPIMSTYLVAFAVGEFDFVETKAHPKLPADAKPITVRVYMLKGQSEKGRFALDVGAKTLEYFSEFFDIAYPLPKARLSLAAAQMDMIAIPDFGAGAMENWGLVTYREVMLLVDENTTAGVKQSIAYVVGHELAHQWFGNLVTMDWWSELWLNEGFATYVGWLSTDFIFPEWQVWTQFVNNDFNRGLGLDGMRSSHPIEVSVKSPSEINQIFDAISYSKGASVIRMLSSFLGTDVFAKGVRAYLKKFAFSNAKTVDLWAALSEASGHDVATIMSAWTLKTGHPVLSVVSESFDATKGELALTIRQGRFLSSGDLTPEEDAETLWTVPLTVSSHLNTAVPTRHVISAKEATITIPYSHAAGHFWKLNHHSTGFFRINLSAEQQTRLGAALRENLNNFSVEDRIGILSDAFATAKAGISSTSGALDIVAGFAAEENYIVLSQLSACFDSVLAILINEPEYVTDGIHSLQRHIFSAKARAVGFEYTSGEDHLTQLKRTLVIRAAADAKDKYVQDELLRRFHAFIAGDESALHPNLRRAAYSTAIKVTKDDSAFEAVLNIAKTGASVESRLAALSNIGGSPNLDVVRRVLDMVIAGDVVRTQDISYPITSVRSSPAIQEVLPIMWNWLKTNWEVLHERLSPTLSLLGSAVSLCTSAQLGHEFADEVEAWARGDDLSTAEAKAKRVEQLKKARRPLDQSLERIRSATKWLIRDREAIAAWVASHKF
nr:Aminopeptidase 2 mitochondrial [Polyrhizophydium stewartii]